MKPDLVTVTRVSHTVSHPANLSLQASFRFLEKTDFSSALWCLTGLQHLLQKGAAT